MFWDIVHAVDITVWCIMALSVGYIAFFAVASLAGSRGRKTSNGISDRKNRFLVIFPAYGEDQVIENSVRTFINQNYPDELYTVTVVSDHMKPSTNHSLAQLNINLLQPTFDKSSKAKAMQYAIQHNASDYDHVVILDADNIVGVDFLEKLNDVCNMGYNAIQCHRCAKNCNNNIAALDGISEEINNSIFRKGHNNIGLSSALIGSGMCFRYEWFEKHVQLLSTAGEDRELEKMLLAEGIYIKYVESIKVLDEKVSSEANFQKQRQRWMSAQIQSLVSLSKDLPMAILHFNINYIDKTIQQALVPRSMLLVGLLVFASVITIMVPIWACKWLALFGVTVVSLLAAMPNRMRSRSIIGLIVYIPRLVWKMLSNIRHIDRKNSEFIHTTHE